MMLRGLDVLVPFIFTFVVEFPVLAIFIRKNSRRTALYGFLINSLTWPIATVLTHSVFAPFLWLWFLVLVEVGVILAEGVLVSLLFEIGRGKSLVISGLANFLSFFVWLFTYSL